MNLLLVGNHTCGNRGDGAILRGLISELKRQNSDANLTIISRFPISSSYLLNEEVCKDCLYHYYKEKKGLIGWIFKKIESRFLPPYLTLLLYFNAKNYLLPERIKKLLKQMENYDVVVQVGGSFFVDLYGVNQFEYILCALLAKKPVYALGHSVGPFENKVFRKISNIVFSRMDMLALRENASLELMEKSDVSTEKVSEGSDTAWLVKRSIKDYQGSVLDKIKKKPTVAITTRELAPFDKRLGVTQEGYEKAVARLIDDIVSDGYQVVILSTCTGIDCYHKDDRMVGLKIKKLTKFEEECFVVMDELNDIELGSLLSHCKLTIGTRLHSVIISMNFGTPGIAINYEHKSEGILKKMGLSKYSYDINGLLSGTVLEKTKEMLVNYDEERSKLHIAVENEKSIAKEMISNFYSALVDKLK